MAEPLAALYETQMALSSFQELQWKGGFPKFSSPFPDPESIIIIMVVIIYKTHILKNLFS